MEIPESGVGTGGDGVARCWWCVGDPLYESYHDVEWGRPVDDDGRLFEKLSLEGFQSGLSWLTILRKRENFRKAFKSFDIEAVARFNTRSVERLLQDSGIVRHRGKIEATINNARQCLALVEEFGSLATYVWSFEPERRSHRPSDWAHLVELGIAEEAVAMSKDLKRRGWSFVGPTTVYSFMEAMGLVNDHVAMCGIGAEVEGESSRFARPAGRLPMSGGVTIEHVRALASTLPRSYEALVRDRVKFRVGRLVYLAFSHDETLMGFAFSKEERETLIASEPEKFMMPKPSDQRYNWIVVRLGEIDEDEMREIVLEAWRMVVPKKVAAQLAE